VPGLRLSIDGEVVGTAGGDNTVDLILNNMVIGSESTAGTSRSFNGLLDDLGGGTGVLTTSAVPEPATVGLLAAGLLGLLPWGIRRRHRDARTAN
jgi:hypothetical protein